MIRKFMVGAVVAAMPLALLTTTSGAAAAKPAITAVSVNSAIEGNVNGGKYAGGTVGYFNTVNITVTGTLLNTGAMDKPTIVAGVVTNPGTAVAISDEKGFSDFLGTPTGKWKINSVTNKSATGFTINATSPNITASLLGGGSYAKKLGANVAITGGGATIKSGTFSLDSNCGPVPATGDPAADKPINGETGVAYVDGDFGSGATQQASAFSSYLKNKPSVYVDVTVLDTVALGSIPKPPLLCASDMGLTPPIAADSTFNANGYYAWAKNYNLYMSGNQVPAIVQSGKFVAVKAGKNNVPPAVVANGSLKGLTFALPYTSNTTVVVSTNVVVYNIPKGMTITACAAGGSTANSNLTEGNQPGHHYLRDNAQTTCEISGSTMTVTDTADHTFTKGDFLDSPAVNLSGISAKAGTYSFTLKSVTSTITLGGNVIDIGFNPAAKSASTHAALFTVVVTS